MAPLRWLESELIDPNDPRQCQRCGRAMKKAGKYCGGCWKNEPDLAHRKRGTIFDRRDASRRPDTEEAENE